MPKKTHRQPPRSKNRPRRPPPRPSTAPSVRAVAAPDEVAPEEEVASAGVVATAPTPARTRPAIPAPAAPAMSRRPTRPGAKVAGITINYAYLRRDLRTLAVLAPLMVVLVIASFFVFH